MAANLSFLIFYTLQLYIRNFIYTAVFIFPMETIVNGSLVGTINGTLFGGPGLVTGKKGLALHTNGRDQYVDFGDQSDTCLGYLILCTHGWVAAFWMQPRNDSNGVIMSTGAMVTGQGVSLVWMAGTLKTLLLSGNKSWSLSYADNTSHGWRHVVVTWHQCHGAKLYKDGRLVSTNTAQFLLLSRWAVLHVLS